jgi:23S rRNA maturation mini-RNase III
MINLEQILDESDLLHEDQSLVYRLKKRAEIRKSITTRKSVQRGETDRLSSLLEEAALRILYLENENDHLTSY